ncbi:hypothetical protein [Burkholderia gladioli]|uniref:hypothetical protein n=1 Tax=Burkholderia gladioli TaxID=28095 RepID=UPI00163EEC64|nr:hypothetical protein [Burkholderia gladioli]
MFQLIWLGCAVATGCAIALDMHQLRVHSVGMTLGGWIVACACTGPVAGAIYLNRRAAAKRALIEAALTFIGNQTCPVHVRRERLIVLERAGLLGPSIYRACSAVLDAQTSITGRPVNVEACASNASDGNPDRSL